MGLLGMIEATIEDLVFTIRSSRETIWGHPQIVGEDVLSTTLLKNKRSGQAWEQRLEWKRLGVNARSSTAAKKDGEGMALKIFTGAKPFLKAYIKPFGIPEMEMLL